MMQKQYYIILLGDLFFIWYLLAGGVAANWFVHVTAAFPFSQPPVSVGAGKS